MSLTNFKAYLLSELQIYESYMIRGLGHRVVYSHYKNRRMSSVLCCYHDSWALMGTFEKQCVDGNYSSFSHSEETNKVRFLEFLVSRKNRVNLMICMHKTF